jgi:carboxylate-amine ligase
MPALDEAFTPDGTVREHYAPVLGAVRDRDLATLAGDLAAAHDMRHGAGETEHAFAFDPLPRVVAAAEWAALEAGLCQRVAALDAFVADAHGAQEAVRAGVVPAAVIEQCPWYERDLVALPAPPVRIGVAGPDVVRGADGRLAVLEDNVRTPTMMAYSAVGRPLVTARLGVAPDPPDLAGPLRDALWRVLRAAAPGVAEPRVAILTEGPANALWWEVDALGRLLDVPVVTPQELRVGDYDVLYRRTSEERLRRDDGAPNELGALLLEPLRAGTVAVVNAFGTGVADDKRLFPYVEDLVRFFCGEEPLLPSVPAFDLTRDEHRQEALDRLGELVVKPRAGSGGHGVVIGPRASAQELEAARRAVAADPGAWIAQEVVELSTHPTVVGGAIEPRHADLRPFAFAVDGEVELLPGAFSRFARDRGDLVVNCSQGGGGRDVWVQRP